MQTTNNNKKQNVPILYKKIKVGTLASQRMDIFQNILNIKSIEHVITQKQLK